LNAICTNQRCADHEDKKNIEFSCAIWRHGLQLNIQRISYVVFKPEDAEYDIDEEQHKGWLFLTKPSESHHQNKQQE